MNSYNVLNKENIGVSKIESKDIFKNLKNDYFLQLLFNHLLKKKLLDIIKYNNKIKDRKIKALKIIKNIQKYIHQLK